MRGIFSRHAFSPFEGFCSLPKCPAPFVQSLPDVTAHLQAANIKLEAANVPLGEQRLQQAETIRELRDEIAGLKKRQGRPIIKPSRMDQGTDDKAGDGSTERGPTRVANPKCSRSSARTPQTLIPYGFAYSRPVPPHPFGCADNPLPHGYSRNDHLSLMSGGRLVIRCSDRWALRLPAQVFTGDARHARCGPGQAWLRRLNDHAKVRLENVHVPLCPGQNHIM